MAQNIIDQVRSIGTTTDGSQTTLLDYASLPANCSFAITAIILAKNTSSGDTAIFWKTAAGKKGASNASIIGSVLDLLSAQKDTSLLLSAASFDTSEGNLRVRVTGLAATTIEWITVCEVIIN